MKYLLLGVYLCLLTTLGAAAPRPDAVVVKDTARVYQLRNQGSVLATNQPLAFAQVRSASWRERFVPVTQAGAPVSAAAEVWLRYTLISAGHPATHWVLSTNTEYMDGLDVYVVQASGQVQHRRMSNALPHQQTHTLRTRHFNLGLSLPPGQSVTVYLKVPSGQVVYPAVAEQAHLLQQYREADWAMGPYFGILLALLAYNLLLYFSVRDKSYLLYVLYVGFFAVLQFDMTGYWRQVWPNDWSGFALEMRQNVVLACTIFFGTLTARAFLDSWRLLPRFDWALKATLLVAWLPLLGAFFSNPDQAIWWQALPALWTCVVLLVAGVLVLRTGYRPARYYMAGWTLLLVAVANFYLGLLGITPRSGFWAAHGVHVASALEMLLLSFGFADRINLAKRDKELAQEAAMQALQEKEAAQSQALVALRETQRAQEVALVVSRENEELQERANHELAERAAELQRAYHELHESIRTSHHLQELDELKTKLFTNISHELRTPLTLIISPLEQLLSEARHTTDAPTPPEYALMLRNARRLLQLINQLLDVARLEAGQMHLAAAPTDMVRTVRTGVSSFESLAVSCGVGLRFETKLENLEVYLDADQFDKILYNLLGNALKFTPAGGEVVVSLGQQAGQAVLRVQDTGVGIPAEHVPLIFDRFHQVDDTHTRRHGGSGIGLALVKELVALHRGNIRVLSALGEGSTFVVELPLGNAHLQAHELCPAAPMSSAVAVPLPDFIDQPDTALPVAPADARPLVLVVEDNPEVRDYIRTCLATEFRVRTANDGAQGLALLKDLEPDLIVSDLMMPQLDGLELCRRLRADEQTAHIPLVLLTARAGDETRLTSFGLGADEYLTKPFQPAELRARIHNLVQQRRLLRQRFGRAVTLQPRDIAITSADEAFLNRAMAVVEQHMANTEFSVEQFADEMALSRVQLHRKLKALTDQSTSEFVRTVRLRRAAALLQAHAGNVAEVAEAVGFSNLSYFSKCFRELHQQSPSEYATQAIAAS
ncbi:response regulator [Hymenobacter oligotrophus]|uniref:histidine kinase n=1 Tax=Hymenobacter oligotrophus TaxID=2319843 RepID=A0A3B7R0K0_9BACT|nr:7TM diverse intracellular signaling domain-containing protein [Hymenobacter oligotrophus]AYA37475.1 response regulator [Hymenobacter oligotrophus]